MRDEDIQKYLPDEETMHRTTDATASEENRRRALDAVIESKALASERGRGAGRQERTEALGEAQEAPARGPRGSEEKRIGGRPRWSQRLVVIGAVMAVVAPAALVYWLLVPSGGRVEEGAGASAETGAGAEMEADTGAVTDAGAGADVGADADAGMGADAGAAPMPSTSGSASAAAAPPVGSGGASDHRPPPSARDGSAAPPAAPAGSSGTKGTVEAPPVAPPTTGTGKRKRVPIYKRGD